jgi:hypothetical protein
MPASAVLVTGVVRRGARDVVDLDGAGLSALGVVVGALVMSVDADGEEIPGTVIADGGRLAIKLEGVVFVLHDFVRIRRRGA